MSGRIIQERYGLSGRCGLRLHSRNHYSYVLVCCHVIIKRRKVGCRALAGNCEVCSDWRRTKNNGITDCTGKTIVLDQGYDYLKLIENLGERSMVAVHLPSRATKCEVTLRQHANRNGVVSSSPCLLSTSQTKSRSCKHFVSTVRVDLHPRRGENTVKSVCFVLLMVRKNDGNSLEFQITYLLTIVWSSYIRGCPNLYAYRWLAEFNRHARQRSSPLFSYCCMFRLLSRYADCRGAVQRLRSSPQRLPLANP
jgi:hypothetical protein